jgi:hypothetical protein
MLDSTPLFYIGQGGLATKTVAGNRTSKYKFCRTEKKICQILHLMKVLLLKEDCGWIDREKGH